MAITGTATALPLPLRLMLLLPSLLSCPAQPSRLAANLTVTTGTATVPRLPRLTTSTTILPPPLSPALPSLLAASLMVTTGTVTVLLPPGTHEDDEHETPAVPSPTESAGCEPHGDHWHCDGPKETGSPAPADDAEGDAPTLRSGIAMAVSFAALAAAVCYV
ncbi:hypothetical protein VTN00DRAFT_8214 [Thermoascus crustaceus]|uniref:uncharacterized protein n=1 Tax=Thermoascus crustaceus TaxID=5088 RepID=UPI00374214CC